mmetsp:Transcript_11453/g.42753  ORF Transcript_11453/g.42753 Transcript_11453/m.42753 type:complete len:349 (-) Transcript_11453:281-1327(-)
MSHFKKFLASRATESAAGRKAIVKHIGEEGHEILHHLKAAAIKFSSVSTGKEMKLHIMKLIMKVAVLVDNGELRQDEATEATQPTLELARLIMDAMHTEDLEARTGFAAGIKAKMEELHGMLLPVLQSKMKASNAGRFTTVVEFFGNEEFLRKLLSEDEYYDDREAIHRNLNLVLSATQPNHTTSQLDEQRRMKRLEHFKTILENPTMRSFHGDTYGASVWDDWLLENKKEALAQRQFLLQVTDFAKIQNRGLLAKRAERLVDNYILTGKVPVSDAAKEEVQTAIETGNVRKNLFDRVREEVTASLETVFNEEFLTSETFEQIKEESLAVQGAGDDEADGLEMDDDDE